MCLVLMGIVVAVVVIPMAKSAKLTHDDDGHCCGVITISL